MKTYIVYSEDINAILGKGFEVKAESYEEVEKIILKHIDIQEVEE